MPPDDRDDSARLTLIQRTIDSPVGGLIAGATPRGVCLCEFADRRALPTEQRDLAAAFGCDWSEGTNEHLDRLEGELARYFAGGAEPFGVALDIVGTAFQRQVWAQLLTIPRGTTTSYNAIARAVGRPGAQRAVGRANGANRIAIVIPCHRVIEQSGGLRGYGGGLGRKRFLLELEGALPATLFA